MRVYYRSLRSIYKAQPQLRRCRTRCWHCGICFFTDPRNAGRSKLGCPFGCARAPRKQESNKRSIAHNRGQEGRRKKGDLNNKKRRKPWPAPAVAPITAEVAAAAAAPPVAVPEKAGPAPWPVSVVMYVRCVASWIEGRPVNLQEVLAMLAKVLRQHSMARRRWIDQSVDWLNEHPP